MSITYYLKREQESLIRAQSSPSACARAAHRGFALAYGKLLVASAYPHNRPQHDADQADQRGAEQHNRAAEADRDDEGALRMDSKEFERLSQPMP
jgi:hypothetical protein